MKKKIIIVDKDDNIVCYKYREDVDYGSDFYRVSCLWLTNSIGEVLIAQRKITKKISPGKWACAVAGTVEEGETYESNIEKEIMEEIGLKNLSLIKGSKQLILGKSKFFAQWYFATIDKPENEFIIEKDEVEKVVWISKHKLMEEVRNNPDNFIGSMPSILVEIYEKNVDNSNASKLV